MDRRGSDSCIMHHVHLQIQSGRRVVPTELGITLVRGYQLIDPELCRPNVRAYVEQQIDLIAKVNESGGE